MSAGLIFTLRNYDQTFDIPKLVVQNTMIWTKIDESATERRTPNALFACG